MSWLDAFSEADEQTIPARLVRREPDRFHCTAEELGLRKRSAGTGPLVSVVIPTYRDSQYLPDALQSVSAQTYDNLEVVLVDSSGVGWVERLAADRDWFHYIAQEPSGVSAARNEGIARATGEYVALLDADDYWHPEKIEKQVEALEGGATASFTCHYFLKFRNNETPIIKLRDRTLMDPKTADKDTLRSRLRPHTSTLVFHRSAVPERPFLETLDNFEDIVFAIELFRTNPPVHLSEPLSVRRLRDGSLSDRTDTVGKFEYKIEAYDYLGRQYPELRPVARRMKAERTFELGWIALERDQRRAARQYAERSLRSSRGNPKAVALYVTALLPIDGAKTPRAVENVLDVVRERLSTTDEHEEYVTIESSNTEPGYVRRPGLED